MSQFQDYNLNPAILRAIDELGFKEPMPIQQETLPVLLSQRTDMVGLAQTGTGKTAAFGLPLLNNIDACALAPNGKLLCRCSTEGIRRRYDNLFTLRFEIVCDFSN